MVTEQRSDTSPQPRPLPTEAQRGAKAPADDTKHPTETHLVAVVGAKEERKLKARRQAHRSVWFGLGMFGMIGWSVALPTVACIALGIWIDRRWPSPYSWTLMLMFLGVVLGCLNAWYWITRERGRLE